MTTQSRPPVWARFWVLFGFFFLMSVLQKKPWDFPSYTAVEIALAVGLSCIGGSVGALAIWVGVRLGLRAQQDSKQVTG